MSKITSYKGISKFYFEKILEEIIKIGDLKNDNKKILDYGCGERELQKKLNKKIFNYDVRPECSELDNINNIDFNTIIINHVLMYLSEVEIHDLLTRIYQINPSCTFIIGIGKQNLLSKIAKNLTLNFNAHEGTLLSYNQQLELIKKRLEIVNLKNVYYMTDIIYAKFI
tara:strand:- start:597 stop:1103 length:507 start_codon:yes stop_codon:yes gene_type:complete